MASGSPFLLGPLPAPPAAPGPPRPPLRQPPQATAVKGSISPTAQDGTGPGRHRPRPSFLTWGWPTPSRPYEGESELPRGPTGWQGPKLQLSGEPCGCRDLCQGRGRR